MPAPGNPIDHVTEGGCPHEAESKSSAAEPRRVVEESLLVSSPFKPKPACHTPSSNADAADLFAVAEANGALQDISEAQDSEFIRPMEALSNGHEPERGPEKLAPTANERDEPTQNPSNKNEYDQVVSKVTQDSCDRLKDPDDDKGELPIQRDEDSSKRGLSQESSTCNSDTSIPNKRSNPVPSQANKKNEDTEIRAQHRLAPVDDDSPTVPSETSQSKRPSQSQSMTPTSNPVPRKRGRPRKTPISAADPSPSTAPLPSAASETRSKSAGKASTRQTAAQASTPGAVVRSTTIDLTISPNAGATPRKRGRPRKRPANIEDETLATMVDRDTKPSSVTASSRQRAAPSRASGVIQSYDTAPKSSDKHEATHSSAANPAVTPRKRGRPPKKPVATPTPSTPGDLEQVEALITAVNKCARSINTTDESSAPPSSARKRGRPSKASMDLAKPTPKRRRIETVDLVGTGDSGDESVVEAKKSPQMPTRSRHIVVELYAPASKAERVEDKSRSTAKPLPLGTTGSRPRRHPLPSSEDTPAIHSDKSSHRGAQQPSNREVKGTAAQNSPNHPAPKPGSLRSTAGFATKQTATTTPLAQTRGLEKKRNELRDVPTPRSGEGIVQGENVRKRGRGRPRNRPSSPRQ